MADSPAAEDAERFADLITQKLLKLPQDPHYIELKRYAHSPCLPWGPGRPLVFFFFFFLVVWLVDRAFILADVCDMP